MLTRTASPQRNLQLGQLAGLLTDQSARALDVIAGSGAIRADGGRLILDGTEPALQRDGVTMTTGSYAVNDVADGQLADKLGIPLPYLRRMHADAVDLYDANVNGWLARTDRRFLIRVLRGGNGSGVVRAVLSDKYSRIDHLDVLMAALDGIRGSGVPVVIDGADLSERRMSVRVYSPDVQAMAPRLLAGYRSPFDGRPGADLPVVWGGFLISNSETGQVPPAAPGSHRVHRQRDRHAADVQRPGPQRPPPVQRQRDTQRREDQGTRVRDARLQRRDHRDPLDVLDHDVLGVPADHRRGRRQDGQRSHRATQPGTGRILPAAGRLRADAVGPAARAGPTGMLADRAESAPACVAVVDVRRSRHQCLLLAGCGPPSRGLRACLVRFLLDRAVVLPLTALIPSRRPVALPDRPRRPSSAAVRPCRSSGTRQPLSF